MTDRRSKNRLRNLIREQQLLLTQARVEGRQRDDRIQELLADVLRLDKENAALVAARAHVAAGLETLQTKLDTLESGIAARTAERITLQEQLSTLRDTEDRQARQLLELRLFIRAVQQLVHGPAPLGQTALPTLGDTLRRLFALLVSPQ